MQINFSALIPYAIGLGVMFFGYFFGLFEGRNQGYKRRKKEEAEEKKVQSAIETPSRSTPAELPPPSPLVAPVENNLLKLSLDKGNRFRLEMDNQSVDTSELTPEQRKRLIELMVTMRPWIEASAAKKPAASPQPAPRPSTPAPPSPPAAAPVSQPKPAPNLGAPASAEEAASASMVAQIDSILQAHLVNTPLANRGIRIVESPQGAMVIVGMERYAGVGAVPDPEIQSVIKAAIAEWEERYTPGV